MTGKAPDVPNLADTFAVFCPDLSLKTVVRSPTLYQDLDRDYGRFTGHSLIALHQFSEDWPTWEMHPAGDEMVVLLSGQAQMVLRQDHSDQAVTLSQTGDFVVVPQGIWHTARVSEPTRMLFITPGEGTTNLPAPP